MNHELELRAAAYVDGALDPAAAADFEARLAVDAELRACVEELRAVARLVGELSEPAAGVPEPPADLVERIVAGAGRGGVPAVRRPAARGPRWRVAAGLSAAAALVLVAVGVTRMPGSPDAVRKGAGDTPAVLPEVACGAGASPRPALEGRACGAGDRLFLIASCEVPSVSLLLVDAAGARWTLAPEGLDCVTGRGGVPGAEAALAAAAPGMLTVYVLAGPMPLPAAVLDAAVAGAPLPSGYRVTWQRLSVAPGR